MKQHTIRCSLLQLALNCTHIHLFSYSLILLMRTEFLKRGLALAKIWNWSYIENHEFSESYITLECHIISDYKQNLVLSTFELQ